MPTSGSIRHRGRIERASETRAADGGVVIAWEVVAERYLEIMPLQGREVYEQASTQGRLTHRIRMRYVRGLKPKDRVTMIEDGVARAFNIVYPVNLRERRQWTECMCIEDLDGG